VQSFNGNTGAVQGVSAAVAGTGISVSGATGAVTITNIGVQSFNGNTGAVTGASLGANTFTGTQTLTAGLTTSYLYASTGSTFGSTLQVNGGVTFASTTDHTGVARFASGVTISGTLNGVTATFSNRVSTSVLGAGSIVPYGKSYIDIARQANARVYIGDYDAAGFNTWIEVDDSVPQIVLGCPYGSVSIGDIGELNTSNYFVLDSNAGSAANAFVFNASGQQPVLVSSTLVNLTNTKVTGLLETTSGISAAGGTFSALTTFTAGISAAGGTFSALTRFTAGISAAGGTFSALTRFTAGISASGINTTGITFGDRSYQATATPDYLLFNMGII